MLSQEKLKEIYRVFDPEPLSAGEESLYVDLDSVRGSSGLVRELTQKIRLSANPTCQLLAGHRGSGKSTELRQVQKKLESGNEKFFSVFCEVNQDLDPNDVDFPDVLIAIVRQIAERFHKKLKIKLKPGYFKQRWGELKGVLGAKVTLEQLELDAGLAKFSAAIKSSPNIREEIRKALEPHTNNWIYAANEVIGEAVLRLSKKGYKGLVVIVDGLDKISLRQHPTAGCTVAEYLFVNRCAQLTAFNCHLIYAMPLALAYSCAERTIANLYGYTAPPVVPMTKIIDAEGNRHQEGFDKLKSLIEMRLNKAGVKKEDVFKEGVIDKVIECSGGQPRELINLVRESIVEGELPIGTSTLESIARKITHAYARQLREEHWKIIDQVRRDHILKRDKENDPLCMELLDSRAILQYKNEKEWYGVNPLLPKH